jgi:hypothetical protein
VSVGIPESIRWQRLLPGIFYPFGELEANQQQNNTKVAPSYEK